MSALKYFLQIPNQYIQKAAAEGSAWKYSQSAIVEVECGEMTVYRASFIYQIPRKTLGITLKQKIHKG